MRSVFVFLVIVGSVFAIESNFYSEEPCLNANGYCVLESECPHTVKSHHKTLCASQKKEGAVCCVGIPQEQLNCNQQNAGCAEASFCLKDEDLGRKGCPTGKTCCVVF